MARKIMEAESHDIPDVAQNLAVVQARIREAAGAAGRDAAEVTLVAVSKTHGIDRIMPALQAGQRVFGENRVQEAAEKWPLLRRTFPDVVLHLIGPLQTNKAKQAADLFDVIETLDRPKLARALATHTQAIGKAPDCFVQINTGEEPQKAGVIPAEADGFIAACRNDYELPVKGVMCIPPADEEPSLHFMLLREIAARNGLEKLSMGMSADYDVAVRFGATHVRVGTAIFGARETP
ncbi:MAG: YggS family pyridoxal phosphate-dependent enzyme [Rhodospirillales bacterium]